MSDTIPFRALPPGAKFRRTWGNKESVWRKEEERFAYLPDGVNDRKGKPIYFFVPPDEDVILLPTLPVQEAELELTRAVHTMLHDKKLMQGF